MEILVCVKRVPDTGAKMSLTADARAVETKNLGFTISPHEECAEEEAVRIIERDGGRSTVLTVGPPEADEQVRDALARGMDRGILLETDGADLSPMQTAGAIGDAVRADEQAGVRYDLLLFGNESADSGGYQVGIRVAHDLGLPVVMGVKALEISGGVAVAKREIATGWEIFEVPLPAVIGVKEGLNLPRHPSLRGRMKAKRKEVDRRPAKLGETGLEMIRLEHPPEQKKEVEMLGTGPEAAPKVVEVLKKLEVL